MFLLLILIPGVRTFLGNILIGCFNITAASWSHISRWLIGGAVVGLTLGLIFFVISWGVGFMAHAPLAGFLIGIIFPAWIFSFLALRKFMFGKVFLWITGIFLFPAILWVAFGIFSPEIKDSFDQLSSAQKRDWALDLDRKTAGKRSIAGDFAFVTEDSVLGDKDGTRVKKGDRVMVITWGSALATDKGEGMSRIMLPNKNGHYSADSLQGSIPTRLLSTTPPPTNGECGPANGQTFTDKNRGGGKEKDYCAEGRPSAIVTESVSAYTWTCFGKNGGENITCRAKRDG